MIALNPNAENIAVSKNIENIDKLLEKIHRLREAEKLFKTAAAEQLKSLQAQISTELSAQHGTYLANEIRHLEKIIGEPQSNITNNKKI